MKLTPKQTKAAREALLKELQTTLRPSRIISLSLNGCTIEGGVFPARFNANNDELTIWGRGNRFSGGEMSVTELEEVQSIVKEFFYQLKFKLERGEL